MPIQKNGFFRHREPVQNPSVFISLVLFKDRMVTNCLMKFCLAIPYRQIACLRDILPHWICICKGKLISITANAKMQQTVREVIVTVPYQRKPLQTEGTEKSPILFQRIRLFQCPHKYTIS